jgi:DNA-binding MarR family transcriptional regulator
MKTKTDNILQAWSAFFEAHAFSIENLEEKLAASKAPLSIREYDTLLTISKTLDRRIRYSELANASVYTKSGVTRVTKRMEQNGYLERQKCKSDGRGAYAALTKKGEKALSDTWMVYSKAVIAIFEPTFTQREAQELSRLMEKVIAHLRPETLVTIKS